MKVVKSANISGTFSSFVPQMERVEAQDALSPDIPPRIEPTELLLSLSPQERKDLLSEIFADELDLLRKQASEEGFASGKSQGELDIKPLLDSKLEELNRCISTWKDMLVRDLDEKAWKLDSEDDFIALLFQGTTKLLSKELSDPQHMADFVAQLVEKYADNKPKKLLLSPMQYQHLVLSESLSSLKELEIVAAPDMQPGSYKLCLASGYVEYDLAQALQEFKTALLSLNSNTQVSE